MNNEKDLLNNEQQEEVVSNNEVIETVAENTEVSTPEVEATPTNDSQSQEETEQAPVVEQASETETQVEAEQTPVVEETPAEVIAEAEATPEVVTEVEAAPVVEEVVTPESSNEEAIVVETLAKEEDVVSTEIEEVLYDAEKTVPGREKIELSDNIAPGKWDPFAVKQSKFAFKKDTTFETRLLQVKRVIKVTKGGRRFKFFALVVVGDKNGRVGFASSKDIEIPNAISKAERLAKKNLYKVKIVGDNKTVAHDVLSKHGSAKVLLKPAAEGKGIIASNNIRAVVELAGYHNIYSKNLGTSNPKNVVIATINALTSMRTKEEISKLRDKQI